MTRAFTFRAIVVGFLLFTPFPTEAALITQNVVYKDGDTELTGYLAYDDSLTTPAPGILVMQEWWGLNDYIKGRAEQLAKLGYVAFAPDMYGTGKQAATVEEAQNLSSPFYTDPEMMRRRAKAGLDVLSAQPQTDKNNLAAIGYCFGGTAALELARSGADIKGVVSFHGGLATGKPATPGTVKAQILALNGGNDPFVPQEQKDAFAAEMKNAGVTLRSIDYPGATHAFTNPAATERGKKFGLPLAYDADADKKSWDEMLAFFTSIFK